ncbi:MAG TPA: PAS domain-containing protein [Allosphingosinicella sp.]|jgi:PAS domain-containing protein
MSEASNLTSHEKVTPDEIIGLALTAARSGEDELRAVLADVPAPIYTTDMDGWVTYYNRACVEFAGRTPVIGRDRWCVTWKLFGHDGAYIPHECCPMAVAVKERRAIRGVLAYAERPDGSRVMFTPFPTPLIDADGDVIGAVNIVLEVADDRQAGVLRAEAMRCRRLAHGVTDQQTFDTLQLMASEYDDKAKGLSEA